MTSTTVGQGLDKSVEGGAEGRGSWQALTTDEREARSHSIAIIANRNESIVHHMTRVTPSKGVSTNNTVTMT